MSIVELAGSLITGVLSGGATGLLGILIQQWGDNKKRTHDLELLKQQHTQTLELRRIEGEQALQMATVSAESAEKLAEIQAAARLEESASDDYRASVASDRATYSSPEAQKVWYVAAAMGFVDFLRGIIRPGITIYSMVLLTLLLYWVHDMWSRSLLVLSQDDTKKLMLEVVGTTTYLVITTTVWWFGRRPESPPKR